MLSTRTSTLPSAKPPLLPPAPSSLLLRRLPLLPPRPPLTMTRRRRERDTRARQQRSAPRERSARRRRRKRRRSASPSRPRAMTTASKSGFNHQALTLITSHRPLYPRVHIPLKLLVDFCFHIRLISCLCWSTGSCFIASSFPFLMFSCCWLRTKIFLFCNIFYVSLV